MNRIYAPCKKSRAYGKYQTGIYQIPKDHYFVTNLTFNNDGQNRTRCIVLNYGNVKAANWKNSADFVEYISGDNPVDLNPVVSEERAIIGIEDSQFTCVFNTTATPEKPFAYTTYTLQPGVELHLQAIGSKGGSLLCSAR